MKLTIYTSTDKADEGPSVDEEPAAWAPLPSGGDRRIRLGITAVATDQTSELGLWTVGLELSAGEAEALGERLLIMAADISGDDGEDGNADGHITVTRVHIPAMSTTGFGYGFDEDGTPVVIVGDHRPMRSIGAALTIEHEVRVDDADIIVRGQAATDMQAGW